MMGMCGLLGRAKRAERERGSSISIQATVSNELETELVTDDTHLIMPPSLNHVRTRTHTLKCTIIYILNTQHDGFTSNLNSKTIHAFNKASCKNITTLHGNELVDAFIDAWLRVAVDEVVSSPWGGAVVAMNIYA